jgi:hypothetical protein
MPPRLLPSHLPISEAIAPEAIQQALLQHQRTPIDRLERICERFHQHTCSNHRHEGCTDLGTFSFPLNAHNRGEHP